MLEKSILAALAVAIALPAPAAAQDLPREELEEMEQGLDALLNDPTMPDRMAAMAVTLLGAMEAMPVGEIEAAMEGRVATREEQARTLGDEIEIDREALAHETRKAMLANRETMQRSVRAMALMLPVIAKAAETMGEAVAEQFPEDR